MKIDYVITKDEPMRLIDFLTKHHYSKLMIKKMIQEKHSFIVNDRYVDINFLLLKDDHLIINLPLEKPLMVESMNCQIFFMKMII